MVPFKLEDFFDKYEHQTDLINLASSDALPWSVAELEAKGVLLPDGASLNLAYPNVAGRLLPNLIRLCDPASDQRVLPTSGAAEAIALVMHVCAAQGLVTRERPLAIPRAGYGAFHGLADLLRLPPVFYDYDPASNWAPDTNLLLELTRRCGAMVITNPHNPTGHVMSTGQMKAIADEMTAHDGILIVDEVFRVPDEMPSAVSLGRHIIVLGSLSKTYGLPGLRLGWIIANDKWLRDLRTVQQYLTLTLNAITVVLGATILEKPECVSRGELIRTNRRVVKDWAKNHAAVASISEPLGGTTVCLTIKRQIGEADLFAKLLEAGVLLAPGHCCFEANPEVCWFRLGYGGDTNALRRGLDLIARALRVV